jgi:hypothetical protein
MASVRIDSWNGAWVGYSTLMTTLSHTIRTCDLLRTHSIIACLGFRNTLSIFGDHFRSQASLRYTWLL